MQRRRGRRRGRREAAAASTKRSSHRWIVPPEGKTRYFVPGATCPRSARFSMAASTLLTIGWVLVRLHS